METHSSFYAEGRPPLVIIDTPLETARAPADEDDEEEEEARTTTTA